MRDASENGRPADRAYRPGQPGKLLQLGTLPVPVSAVTVTPVPDGARLVLYILILA